MNTTFSIQSASAQRDLDVYKDKIASLKKTIKEDGHYADTDSLFVKVGLDDVQSTRVASDR